MTKKEEKTFKFIYKLPENYNPVYVNGAFGGITTKGEIVVNFFLERTALPVSDTHEVKDDKLGEIVQREFSESDQPRHAIRYVESGIVLSLRHAKSIHAWLGKRVEELEEVSEQIKKLGEQT